MVAVVVAVMVDNGGSGNGSYGGTVLGKGNGGGGCGVKGEGGGKGKVGGGEVARVVARAEARRWQGLSRWQW